MGIKGFSNVLAAMGLVVMAVSIGALVLLSLAVLTSLKYLGGSTTAILIALMLVLYRINSYNNKRGTFYGSRRTPRKDALEKALHLKKKHYKDAMNLTGGHLGL
jgi:hypothetical protein